MTLVRPVTVQLLHGDCMALLPTLPAESVDAVVCDPPYHLTSIVKRFGGENAAPAKSNGATGVYARASSGFMNQKWDGGDIAFRPETWVEVLRVLKPGGHLVAFGSSRGCHRMACAIEDAGFEVRDQLMWLYGSGFPKSHNVSVAIDKAAGAEREYLGEGPYAARKPRPYEGGNALNISVNDPRQGHPQTAPATDAARQWAGWGTALKPSHEPICLARKPLSEATVAANVLRWGTGALNIDGCRVEGPPTTHGGKRVSPIHGGGQQTAVEDYAEHPAGRWPANVCHDGSDEVLEAFARAGERGGGGKPRVTRHNEGRADETQYRIKPTEGTIRDHGDTGSAARFFKSAGYTQDDLRFMYCGKSSAKERHAGLDDFVLIDIIYGWKTEQADAVQLAKLLVDTAQSPLKATAVSGTGRNSVIEWSMSWFGSRLTDLFRQECTSTTATITNSTTRSAISNSLIRYLTREGIADANSAAANGGSHAENAENGIKLPITISGPMAYHLGVGPAASPMQLQINVSCGRNAHPTIKPQALMAWLVRLTCPPGGTVLDHFLGSGTTALACLAEGMHCIGIEQSAEYLEIARARVAHAQAEAEQERLRLAAEMPLFTEFA